VLTTGKLKKRTARVELIDDVYYRGVNYSPYTSSKIPKNLWKNPKILLNPRIKKSQEIFKNCIKYLEKAQ
jgi:hypothetical protein